MSNGKKGEPQYVFLKSVAPGVKLPIWGKQVCEKDMKDTHLIRDQTDYIGARQMIDTVFCLKLFWQLRFRWCGKDGKFR